MKDKFLDAKGLGYFWKRIVEYIKGTTPTKVSQLENDSHYMADGVTSFNGSTGAVSFSETDPTVPAWAKQSTKPSYTAVEVGALPDSTVIPEGIPAGGTTGQVLRKTSDADYAVEWHDEEGGGGEGVQSDWNQSDSTKLDYIKNKPTIPAEVTEFTVSGWGFTKNTGTYSKPSNGIPSADLSSDVQTSLGKADTAIQAHQDISGKADKATTLAGYGITDAKIASGVITLGSDTITPLTSHQDISSKADKVSSATSGNFAALDSNGNLTDSGHKHSDYLTSHQDISNYVQKSETAGLIKNDGSIDTNTYLTSAHEVPSGGNAGQILSKSSATDYDMQWVNQTITYPSAYCTTAAGTAAKKASCSLYALQTNSYVHVLIGASNTSASALTLSINSTTAKPIYINGAASSSSNYTLPAGTYIVFYDGTNYYFRTDGKMPGIGGYLESTPTIATSLPVGDLAVNTYYALSTALTGAVTVTLPSVSDTAHVASIALSFETGSGFTSLTITPPSGVTVSYYDGYSIEASKEYELNLLWNGTKWIVSYAVVE